MIPISDLRKNNLIKTEYGILPVHAIVFNEVQVKGKDGRILWAKETEGVELSEKILSDFRFNKYDDGGELKGNDCFYIHEKTYFSIGLTPKFCLIGYRNVKIHFVHELQNIFYWLKRKELEIDLNKNMDGFDILIDSTKRAGQAHTKIMNDIKKQFSL